jgi:hypothetical protein
MDALPPESRSSVDILALELKAAGYLDPYDNDCGGYRI